MRGQKQRKAEIKRMVLAKTDGVCARCGKVIPFERVTIEHFIPKYRGGSDDERNLLPLCKNCNKHKGSRIVTVEDYYPFLKTEFYSEANDYKLEWESEKNIKVTPKSYDVLDFRYHTCGFGSREPSRTISFKMSSLTDAQYKNAVIANIGATPAGGVLRIQTDTIACFDRAMLEAFAKKEISLWKFFSLLEKQ